MGPPTHPPKHTNTNRLQALYEKSIDIHTQAHTYSKDILQRQCFKNVKNAASSFTNLQKYITNSWKIRRPSGEEADALSTELPGRGGYNSR